MMHAPCPPVVSRCNTVMSYTGEMNGGPAGPPGPAVLPPDRSCCPLRGAKPDLSRGCGGDLQGYLCCRVRHGSIYDIAESANHIVEFTAGRAYDEYRLDPMLCSAVERQFEIIGEALNNLLRQEPGIKKRISDANPIIAFRNRLIHWYVSVSDEVVRGVLPTHHARCISSTSRSPDARSHPRRYLPPTGTNRSGFFAVSYFVIPSSSRAIQGLFLVSPLRTRTPCHRSWLST